jgi:hypothetical protein
MADLKSIATIPSINSSDEEWIAWHKNLKRETGKINANDLFIRAWKQRKNENPIFGSKANTSKLRNYLSSQGLDLSGDGAFGFAYDVMDNIEDFAISAFNTGKWMFIIILAVVLIPLFIMMLNIAKNPQMLSSAINPVK